MALISTVAAADANSYADVDFVNSFIDGHPYATTWVSAEFRESELRYATVLLDSFVNWDGQKSQDTKDTQALEWPRDLLVGYNTEFTDAGLFAMTRFGTGYYDPTDYNGVIPVEIKRAQVELALYLSNNVEIFDKKELSDITVSKIKLKIDTSKVFVFPPQVMAHVSKFGSMKSGMGGSVGNVRLVRA